LAKKEAFLTGLDTKKMGRPTKNYPNYSLHLQPKD
jgi:hypothetical protein